MPVWSPYIINEILKYDKTEKNADAYRFYK